MKVFQLIDFTKNHTVLNRVCIESCYEGKYPCFGGSVTELLENQYEYLDLPIVNANYDKTNAQLNIFYNPEDLGEH